MKRAAKKGPAKQRRRKSSKPTAKSANASKRRAQAGAKTAAKRPKAKAKQPVAKLNRKKLARPSKAKKSSSAKDNGAKPNGKATPLDPKKEIEEIKKQLRHQITTGQDVTNLNDEQALEARSLQMRVAQLEAAVARAENADADATPGLELKVRAKTQDLKTRLKDD